MFKVLEIVIVLLFDQNICLYSLYLRLYICVGWEVVFIEPICHDKPNINYLLDTFNICIGNKKEITLMHQEWVALHIMVVME